MNIDWSQLITKQMKIDKVLAAAREQNVISENAWREDEMNLIADQLLRIEDDDPTALPGSASQWRAYRIKVRAWIEGALNFPNANNRPSRPE